MSIETATTFAGIHKRNEYYSRRCFSGTFGTPPSVALLFTAEQERHCHAALSRLAATVAGGMGHGLALVHGVGIRWRFDLHRVPP